MKTIMRRWAAALILGSLLSGNHLRVEVATSSSAGNKLEWTFKHDDAGRLTLLRDPGGREITFDYVGFNDEPGRIKTMTRRSEGSEVVYEFDPSEAEPQTDEM